MQSHNAEDWDAVIEKNESLLASPSLTPEDAEFLLDHNRGLLDLSQLKVLTPETAQVLARFDGDLVLNSVSSLSQRTASALVQHEGRIIELDGLESLSTEVATVLAEYEGELSLNGLKEIGAEASRALLRKAGGRLYLFGSVESNGFSLSGPGVMVHYQGKLVRQESIVQLKPDLAAILAEQHAIVYLPRVTDLSLESARNLAKHAGRYLSLSGLRTISVDLAEALASHKGHLALDCLTKMPHDVAEVLATRQCRSFVKYIGEYLAEEGEVDDMLRSYDVYSESVYYLNSEAADAVMERGEDPKLLGSPTYDQNAEYVYAKYQGQLSLCGLTEIPDKVAERLSEHDGDLYLNGLTTLTNTRLATKLAKSHSYSLEFPGLTNLTEGVAAALAEYRGWLKLDSIQTLTRDVAGALAKRSDALSLRGLKSIEGDVEAMLKTNPQIEVRVAGR